MQDGAVNYISSRGGTGGGHPSCAFGSTAVSAGALAAVNTKNQAGDKR